MSRVALSLVLTLAATTQVACGDELGPPATDTSIPVDTFGDIRDTQEPPPDVDVPRGLALIAVSPGEGRTSGLEEVHLTGSGLADVVEVLFGDTSALDPFAVNDSLLVALSPPRPRGLVDVTVVTASGERATLPLAFEYADPVQVTAVEPSSGNWLGGERVTVYGAGFTEDAVVLIGGRAALAVTHVDDGTLTAITPEGTPGKADVHVSTSEGIARLREGYVYVGADLPASAARIVSVSPAHGPVAGGTAITITGSGFVPGAAVHVGALAASAVVVDGSGRITARTPLGSPGAATVRVIQSGAVASLEDGFTYDGPPALWVVDPPQGAVAGNTRVTLRGHGFPTSGAVQVSFGGRAAREVEVIDGRTITCRTPAGEIGLVEVAVNGAGVAVSHPQGFSYFDPAATPGTWGGPIAGNLNITVQDARAGTRLGGVTVVLGESARSTLRGFTDANGQITFSAEGLAGPQIATASITGYQVFQLAGFDAENVTLPLERIPTCADLEDMPCDQVTEPPPVAYLTAKIVGSEKGPTIPYGECRDWRDAPNGLCQACAVDADCEGTSPVAGGALGDGTTAFAPAICRELGHEGAFCSFACTSDNECPGGFVCLDPTGMELERRCVPPPGERVAYCDQTEPDLWSDDMIAYPGVKVPASKVVQVGVHLGDFAFFCWAGVEVRGDFRPQFLGIVRGLGAYENGARIETEVSIDIPLTQRVVIEVDKPANGVFGQELTVVKTALNLGGDGVLSFPTRRGFLTDRFVLMVPEALTGELYDATWEVFTEIDVTPLNGGSALYERGWDRLDKDIDYVREAGVWAPFESPAMTTRALTTWQDGGGVETVVAVGERGAILKRYGAAGTSWAQMSSATDRELMAIAVAPAEGQGPTLEAIAVGQGGVAVHWDGLRWRLEETGTRATLEGVSFGSDVVAYAVAGPYVLRWDGATWGFAYQASANLHAVVGLSEAELYAVGDGGLVVHGLGDIFSEVETGVGASLRAITKTDGGALFAVGDAGAILRKEGSGWVAEASGTGHDLLALVARDDAVWAVGGRATILHRTSEGWVDETVGTTRSTLRAVAAAGARVIAMGSHELVLGPLLGVPEDLVPAPGGTLNDRLEWTARPGLDPHFSLIEFGSEVGPCSACGFMFMLPYSEWRSVLHGDLFQARFPDFTGLPNTVALGRGFKGMTLYRVRADENFDFDHTATTGFFGGTWRAWSWRTEAFLR